MIVQLIKMESYKSFRYILLIALNASLGGFSIGYKLGEMNMVQINMKYIYEWSSSEENFYMGAMTSFCLLGLMVGSFLTGFYLLNIFGRRWNLILADILLIVGVFFMLLVGFKGFPQILGRFICGLSGGINCTIIPSYIAEMSPVKIRGEISSYYNTTLLIGIFASYLLSVGIPMEETLKTDVSSGFWRFLFFFPIIFSIFRISMLFSYFNFEPAPYLLAENREEEALEVISKIYKKEYVEDVLLEYKHYLEKTNQSNMTYRELFQSKYRSRLFISIVLFFTQTFAGTNAVIYYSAILFGGPNVSEIGLKSFFILMSAIFAASSYLSSKIVDKYGRKALLLWGCSICMIQQFITFLLISILDEKNPNIFIESLTKIVILSFFFIFGLTLSPVCWILAAEILNDKGVSICGISAWGSNFLLGFLFPFAISLSFIKVQGTFLIFSLVLLFGIYFIRKYVKETFGKTSEEIDELYSNSNYDPLLKN